MTLLYRLLLALFGALVAIAPTTTVKVIVRKDAAPGGGEKRDKPLVRKVRPVVLKDAAPRETRLEVQADEREPDPEPDAADEPRRSPFVPVRTAARTLPLPRPRPVAPNAADVRAGRLDLPPPSTRNA